MLGAGWMGVQQEDSDGHLRQLSPLSTGLLCGYFGVEKQPALQL